MTHVCNPSIKVILRERLAHTSAMTALLGWALAALAVVVGYLSYGWSGLALALTLTAFWLLLQFSRALRVLRIAAANPVGQVANAVMFQAKLNKGMRLPDVLKLTRSLGKKLADEPETYLWTDAAGDSVQVQLRDGRLSEWQLQRHEAPGGAPGAGA
jgi:hypothetical protein